uniref:Uncharacterized protein n=1 Tax=Haptolina brevifila TaxID=156173 RepID=A0A7S2IDA4_9EUKA|mmetsp:Transcript_64648/g.127759  ORF Transcript_64648/g.127759 Transcript_64648/m.127759 type:complete len:357 (+) Transcript_64648:79-1149(+)
MAQISSVPPADLLLVPEPKSKSAGVEASLLDELNAKRKAAKKAVQQRKAAEKANLTAHEKKEKATGKKELRELQKSEYAKPVIDHQHNGVWDTEADKRAEKGLNGEMSSGEAARAKAQKAMDRRIQKEREETEAFQRAFDLREQRKAEKAEREMREKVRLQQAADKKAEKEEARRVKAEMEARSKEVLAREAAAAKDKMEDALRERKVVLAKKAAADEWDRQRLADWKRDINEKREKDNIREQKEKQELEEEEKARRAQNMADWEERERIRLEEEAAALAKYKADVSDFHSHAREKAIQDELLRLQKKLDAEHMMTSAAEYRAQQAAKNAKALSNWAHNLDHEVKTIRKESKVKLW